jgi:transposase
VRTNPDALRACFGQFSPLRIALEAGTHSPWVSHTLKELGHEVVVANPRQIPLNTRHLRKSDRVDAEMLARMARYDPALLRPIEHRGRAAQRDLTLLRARGAAVKVRTELVNVVRGMVKASGERLSGCDSDQFGLRMQEELPAELRPALLPLVKEIARLTETITEYGAEVAKLAGGSYPETGLLLQVHGVGPITALTYVLTLEAPERFAHSRQVGAYLGLVPRRQQSGERDPQLPISRAGDEELRRLLVQCAHCILRPKGRASDLLRWGLEVAERRGKKKAVVAVARKLAVLLHRLWSTGEVYEPLRQREEVAMAG